MGVRTEQRAYLVGNDDSPLMAAVEDPTIDDGFSTYRNLNDSTKQFITKARGRIRMGGRRDDFRDYEDFREWFLEELDSAVNPPNDFIYLWDGVDVEALTRFVWVCELT